MKTKLMVSLLILVSFSMLVLLCSCNEPQKEKIETENEAHSVLCMIFLGKDEKMNGDIITAVTKLRKSLQHRIHPIVFTPESQQEKAAQDIINRYNINKFPAVIIDGKLLTEGESLEQAAEEAAKREMITIDQNLARDIIDEETLVVTFYVCCYEEGEYIENGRVMVYLVERDEYEETYIGDTYRALIADSKEYYVESGSCHVPEMVYWQIPEGVDPEYLHIVMVVYDDEDKVLGTCCSAEDCSEKS